MAQDPDELIPPRMWGSYLGGFLAGMVYTAVCFWAIISYKQGAGVIGLFIVIFNLMVGALWALACFSKLVVQDSWLAAPGRLDKRHRILDFTWNSQFPGLKHFELVNGVWLYGSGSTDRLQFWIDGRKKPIQVTSCDSDSKYNGQWSLKRQGLSPSPIQMSPEEQPSNPLAAAINKELLSLGVFLAKQTQRPLHFSQEVVKLPSRGD